MNSAGRFFAVNEVKALLARDIIEYEIKFSEGRRTSTSVAFWPGVYPQKRGYTVQEASEIGPSRYAICICFSAAGRQGNTGTIRENFARRPRFSCIDDHQRADNSISDRTSMRAFLFFEKPLNVELKKVCGVSARER